MKSHPVVTEKNKVDTSRPRVPEGLVEAKKWPVVTYVESDSHFDIDTWRFRTDGLVENSLELTYEELFSMPKAIWRADHHCVDGWCVLGLEWGGIEFSTIKDLTKPISEARYIMAECEGGFSERFDIDDDFLLAYERSGEELSRGHGYPLRIVFPGKWGGLSSKWLKTLRFVRDPERTYWEGYLDYLGLAEYGSWLSASPWGMPNDIRKEFVRKLRNALRAERRRLQKG